MRQDIYVPGFVIAGVAFLLMSAFLTIAWQRLRKLKRATRQLRNDLAEMEMAYENAPLGLAMLDRNLRYIRISKLLAQLNGLSVREHIGKTIHEIVPEIAPQAEVPFLQVLRTGKPLLGIVFEGATPAEPGIPRFWRENVYPIFSDDGELIGINVAVEDITEEKRLTDALKASELRERQRANELEVIMNTTPAAIFMAHDASCSHVIGNPEGNRMLRLKEGENASANPPDGRHSFLFLDTATGNPLRADELPLQVATATGKEVRGRELTHRFKNGDILHLLANAAPLVSETGEIAGAVCSFIDVTTQKQAEQALLRDARKKDEFLATLAHELRNPLASIQTGLELMKLSPAVSPSLAHTRGIMERQLFHLVRLIDDLLDVSRIRTGKMALRKDRIEVRSIIEHALEVSQPHIEAAGHALEVKLPSIPIYLDADLVRMAQAISNLLNNAAKYTPEGGRIELAVEADAREVLIRVNDNGIGIERETLPKVFDMFSQMENARSRRQGGLGIGLSLARRLVAMHGGALTAESGGPGCGSTFSVRLPRCDAPVLTPKHEQPEDMTVTPETRRILILDDNIDAANTLGALLELSGHTIELAYTGQDALGKARQFRPEIAFLDIGLPDMSGFDVARALRQEVLPGATLIALTGWGTPKDRLECKDAGFDFHLTKPVSLDAIKAILPNLKMPSIH